MADSKVSNDVVRQFMFGNATPKQSLTFVRNPRSNEAQKRNRHRKGQEAPVLFVLVVIGIFVGLGGAVYLLM